mmetsp:Transcript_10852/g.33481  ORF Transcript_10852/g.33481 Transcript_10852/m.33481 type:complete len:316 (+) Transcript_10852:306-1253(+)
MAEAPKLPAVIVDPHHHFYEPSKHAFSAYLGSLGAPDWTPEEYVAATGALNVTKSVHVEALPDDGVAEAAWVASLVEAGRAPTVKAVVGKCDLAAADAAAKLDDLKAAAPGLLRGIRYIIDYDGPFGEDNGTHVEVKRHGLDYLRDAAAAASFERGFALLADRGLSYDLQCAPAQLDAAAALCARHPRVAVVLDHAGKARKLDGSAGDAAKLDVWRAGVAKLAALPQVRVKLSMLGYLVPGWTADAAKEAVVAGLAKELLALFGPRRCMFASNWHGSGSSSNADYCGPAARDPTHLGRSGPTKKRNRGDAAARRG